MRREPRPKEAPAITEMLVMPDGQVLVHNLTRRMAVLLAELDPGDHALKARATRWGSNEACARKQAGI